MCSDHPSKQRVIRAPGLHGSLKRRVAQRPEECAILFEPFIAFASASAIRNFITEHTEQTHFLNRFADYL